MTNSIATNGVNGHRAVLKNDVSMRDTRSSPQHDTHNHDQRPRQPQELTLANSLQLEALTQLGIKKGLWTAEEFTAEVQGQQQAFIERRAGRREQN